MNLRSFARPSAAGAVAALALGALAAVAPSAVAAPATNSYTCAIPVLGDTPVTVTTDTPVLPQTAPAGLDVAAGLLPVTNRVTIPKAVRDGFAAFQVTSVAMPDFALAVGSDAVAVSGLSAPTSAFVADAGGQTYSTDINGTNGAFDAPAAGTHGVTAPASFMIKATRADGGVLDIACTIAAGTAPASIASITTSKNAGAVKVTRTKVKAGKVAKVKVKVSADHQTPTGRVIATIGKKRVGKAVLNDAGKAVVKVKAKFLKKKKSKIKLTYVGDGYTNKAVGKGVVRVTR